MKACFQIASAAYFLRKDIKKYPLAQIIPLSVRRFQIRRDAWRETFFFDAWREKCTLYLLIKKDNNA